MPFWLPTNNRPPATVGCDHADVASGKPNAHEYYAAELMAYGSTALEQSYDMLKSVFKLCGLRTQSVDRLVAAPTYSAQFAELYMIFDKVIAARKKEGRTDTDALQYLIDQGDDTRKIITVSVCDLF